MFILRSADTTDLNDMFRLSEMVLFINLPPDEEIIQKKIQSSLESFKNPSPDLWENYYIFVIEEVGGAGIVGVSMIHSQHGTEDEPHFFLKVSQEHKYSQTINTGFIHGTLKLGLETDGPTEIGGLIIHPEFRGHKEKLGKQIAFVRFLFMGMHPERFKPVIHSELMPPLDKNGDSPLWEAIGRRFLNMNYHEADVLSRSNKEFILSLYPSENIYQTLLPLEARNAIGKVGADTEPIKKMLESIGFQYTNEVDPFDGGPHYRCPLKDVKLVRKMVKGKIINKTPSKGAHPMIIHLPNSKHDFLAIKTNVEINGTELWIDGNELNKFPIQWNQETYAIPF